MAACCDIAFADVGTKFAFSEVRLGLSPAVISPFVLEKVPLSWASRAMLTGEAFFAPQAVAAGLVTEVTGGEGGGSSAGDLRALDVAVDRTLAALAANGPEAVRATKALLRSAGGLPERPDLRAFTARTIAERRASAEGQEGLRAFLEKREPAWKSGGRSP